jgi:hypothetical protein
MVANVLEELLLSYYTLKMQTVCTPITDVTIPDYSAIAQKTVV